MNEELWVPVTGYEGRYSVSNFGKIKSHIYKKDRILKATKLKTGYLDVQLQVGKIIKHQLVHRVVLSSFLGSSNLCACHKNNVKDDNRLENLYWASHAENMAQRNRDGLQRRGTDCYNAKLNDGCVAVIRQAIKNGVPQKKLARILSMNQSNIWMIVNGKSWVSSNKKLKFKTTNLNKIFFMFLREKNKHAL